MSEKISKNAKQFARKRYGIDNVIKILEDYYSNLALT